MKRIFSQKEIQSIKELNSKKVSNITKAIDKFTNLNLSQAVKMYIIKYTGAEKELFNEVFPDSETVSENDYRNFKTILKNRQFIVQSFRDIIQSIDGQHVAIKVYKRVYKEQEMQARNVNLPIDKLDVVHGVAYKPFGVNVPVSLLKNVSFADDKTIYVNVINTDTAYTETVCVKATYNKALLNKCLNYLVKNIDYFEKKYGEKQERKQAAPAAKTETTTTTTTNE